LQGLKLPRAATCFRKPRAIGLHRAFAFEPRKCLLEHLRRPDIRRHDDAIVHPLPFSAGGHDSGTPQVCQMPGYLGLRLIQNFNKITDTNLLIAHQIQEPQPRIVTQGLKETFDIEILFSDLHKMIISALTNVYSNNIVALAHMSQGGTK
jgi:hypothetical protein